MMSRWLFALFTATAIAGLPRGLFANDSERPAHPGPDALFKRLDANKDGQITADEIPAGAPDRFKAMLKRADRDGDEKLTAEELGQAMRHSYRSLREAHSQRPGPPHPPGLGPPRRASTAPPPSPSTTERRRPTPLQSARPRGARPQPHGAVGTRPGTPDPKTPFARLDRDNDGQLSFAEFAGGMRQFHQHGRPPFAGRPGPPVPGRRLGPPRLSGGMLAGGAFQKADADHDGKVTLAEVPSDRREGFAKLLRLADKDGDKALSAEEAKRFAAAAMMRARMAMAHRAIEARTTDTARRVVAARQAAEAQRAATARRAASARQAVEARRSTAARQETAARGRNAPPAERAAPPAERAAPPAERAAPPAKRPAVDKKTPEARKKAAEAKRAAAKAKRAAAKKAAEVRKRKRKEAQAKREAAPSKETE